jgi:hypothetical protein
MNHGLNAESGKGHAFFYLQTEKNKETEKQQNLLSGSGRTFYSNLFVLLLIPSRGFLLPLMHFTLEIDVNDFFEHAVDSICIIERAVCHVMSL